MATCSLIIPVYNHAAYLAQCIDSALQQVDPFDEIVIVDDCSPDPAVEKILRSYANSPRVRLYRNPENIGICATQNYAVSLCTSEFVAFLDCDDVLAKVARRAFNLYHAARDADYFFSNRFEIGPSGERLRNIDVAKQIFAYNTLTQCLMEHMVASHFKVIRKRCLDEIGGFPASSEGVQDWVVAVNIINDTNAVHIAEYVYFHRIHSGQTTAQDSVRYVSVVNAERERKLATSGLKAAKLRPSVRRLTPYFARVAKLPEGAFLLVDGLMIPWVPSWIRAEPPPMGSLLFYMPGHHATVAQNFYTCREIGAESVMIVDYGSPRSIALTRWANAFFDHIICLNHIARLAIEPWTPDKSKIIVGGAGNISIKLPVRLADDAEKAGTK